MSPVSMEYGRRPGGGAEPILDGMAAHTYHYAIRHPLLSYHETIRQANIAGGQILAIQSFKDAWSEKIHNMVSPGKGFPADLIRVTQRKLAMLDAAKSLDDLKAPPANKLEALKKDRGASIPFG